MAIQINVGLTKAGIPIPSGSMIKASTEFPDDIITRDEEGVITNKKRILRMSFRHFPSKVAFNNSPGLIDGVDQFPPAFVRELTDEDFTALSGANALLMVETWLKNWLESQPGVGVGNCSIVNPYL